MHVADHALAQHGEFVHHADDAAVVDDTIIASELAAMSDQRIAPTDNRSIVGVMSEFGIVGERMFGAVNGDLPALSMRMSTMIVGPLMKGTGSPDRNSLSCSAPTSSRNPRRT